MMIGFWLFAILDNNNKRNVESCVHYLRNAKGRKINY